jgi:hypothetical protein
MDEKQLAIETLRSYLSNTKTIYFVLRRVMPSGECRHVSVFYAKDSSIMDITYWVAQATEHQQSEISGSLVIKGKGNVVGIKLLRDINKVISLRLKKIWL